MTVHRPPAVKACTSTCRIHLQGQLLGLHLLYFSKPEKKYAMSTCHCCCGKSCPRAPPKPPTVDDMCWMPVWRAACRALDVYGMMTHLPGVHPDSTLYRTIISTFRACGAPEMVLQVALIMAQQVGAAWPQQELNCTERTARVLPVSSRKCRPKFRSVSIKGL